MVCLLFYGVSCPSFYVLFGAVVVLCSLISPVGSVGIQCVRRFVGLRLGFWVHYYPRGGDLALLAAAADILNDFRGGVFMCVWIGTVIHVCRLLPCWDFVCFSSSIGGGESTGVALTRSNAMS